MYYSIFKDNLFVCKLFLIKLECFVTISEPLRLSPFLLLGWEGID